MHLYHEEDGIPTCTIMYSITQYLSMSSLCIYPGRLRYAYNTVLAIIIVILVLNFIVYYASTVLTSACMYIMLANQVSVPHSHERFLWQGDFEWDVSVGEI